MTEAEKLEKQKEAISKAEKIVKDRKAAEIKEGFLNPLGDKTTYAEFIIEVEKSNKSVEDYCKGNLDKDEINWINKELSLAGLSVKEPKAKEPKAKEPKAKEPKIVDNNPLTQE